MTGAQYTSCLISLSLKVFLDNFTFVFGLVINLYFYKDELTLEQSLITVLKGIEILANSLREPTFLFLFFLKLLEILLSFPHAFSHTPTKLCHASSCIQLQNLGYESQ